MAGAAWLTAVVLAACTGSGTPAPAAATASASAGSPASAVASVPVPVGSLRVKVGADLCGLLTAADFTAAGVPGAGAPTKNSTDPSAAYCVYAGKSSGTGGIEFDAFVGDGGSVNDLDMNPAALDVTASVPGADKAIYEDTPPVIGVAAGNLVFDIGFPTSATAKDQAIALARVVLAHAAALAP